MGSYTSHAHDFVKPDTPPGKLLALRWKAVPALLDGLADEKLTPKKRAWVLALLFSITGRNDPRGAEGVLGSYSDREAGWQVWGGVGGKAEAGGFGGSEDGHVWDLFGRGIDAKKQRIFAERWRAFKDFIVVRER